MSNAKRKLLLIACSGRKIHAKGLMPAIERYDGVNYRVIHKLQREGRFPKNVEVKILSAEFGLIDASTPIPYYDRRMDKQRAMELRERVSSDVKRLLDAQQYDEIFVNMGQVYFSALDGFENWSDKHKVRIAAGGIGSKMSAMKEWLES